jgi:hypothetical protein
MGAGSGKTFSMMGDEASPGIIPLLNRELFDRVRVMHAEKPDRELMVIVSFLEIYNECIKVRRAPVVTYVAAPPPVHFVPVPIQDLLNPSDKQLTIREHPDLGVYVQDIAELVVVSAEDVFRLLDQVRSGRCSHKRFVHAHLPRRLRRAKKSAT